MIISYTHEVPMGHRLMNHTGKCKYLHGHNYLVTVSVEGPLDDQAMVLDYSELKRATRAVLDLYDHAFTLEVGDPAVFPVGEALVVRTSLPPTAEFLAEMWAHELQRELQNDKFRISVAVRETRDTEARYTMGSTR